MQLWKVFYLIQNFHDKIQAITLMKFLKYVLKQVSTDLSRMARDQKENLKFRTNSDRPVRGPLVFWGHLILGFKFQITTTTGSTKDDGQYVNVSQADCNRKS